LQFRQQYTVSALSDYILKQKDTCDQRNNIYPFLERKNIGIIFQAMFVSTSFSKPTYSGKKH